MEIWFARGSLLAAFAALVSGAYAKSTGVSFGFESDWSLALPRVHLAASVACALALVGVTIGRLPRVAATITAVALLAFTGVVAALGLHIQPLVPTFAILHAAGGIGLVAVLCVVAVNISGQVPRSREHGLRLLRVVGRVLVISATVQVALGAAVRHLGAGLAIRDFPLAMGRLVPELSSPFVALHYAHRVMAMVVVTLAIIASGVASIDLEAYPALGRIGRALAALASFQIALGAYVIWWERDVTVTVAHVVNGSAVFALSLLLWARTPSAGGVVGRAD